MTQLDLSTWLLPDHPSPYGHMSFRVVLPPYWKDLNIVYENVSNALERYIQIHPISTRWPGVALWLHFQVFSDLITDLAFHPTTPYPTKAEACVDSISLLVNLAQRVTSLDHRLTFTPLRLRDLPNRIVSLISNVVGQMRRLPPEMVQGCLRRKSTLVIQLEELVRYRGGHGPLLFPKLWIEVDQLKDMRDWKRAKAALEKVLKFHLDAMSTKRLKSIILHLASGHPQEVADIVLDPDDQSDIPSNVNPTVSKPVDKLYKPGIPHLSLARAGQPSISVRDKELENVSGASVDKDIIEVVHNPRSKRKAARMAPADSVGRFYEIEPSEYQPSESSEEGSGARDEDVVEEQACHVDERLRKTPARIVHLRTAARVDFIATFAESFNWDKMNRDFKSALLEASQAIRLSGVADSGRHFQPFQSLGAIDKYLVVHGPKIRPKSPKYNANMPMMGSERKAYAGWFTGPCWFDEEEML